jgi:acyl-CoA reductase-like NAD-dependent aldehyde dehydrogenase
MKIQSINPATEAINKEFDAISDKEALEICRKAKDAAKAWRDIGLEERLRHIKRLGEILREKKNDYAKLATLEMGRLYKDAVSEVEGGAALCDLLVSKAKGWLQDEPVQTEFSKSVITFEPIGTVLLIMPWNFPYSQVHRSALPALTAGNTVVLRHSGNVPMVAQAIAESFKKAGFPEHVFNNILVDHSAIPKLIRSRFIDGVSFTGSTGTGRIISKLAASSLKKCVLELGGSNSFIVLSDADIGFTANQAVASRIPSCGQSCSASKRFITVKDVADDFTKRVVDNTKALVIGDPIDPNTRIGPLANRQQLEKLDGQVKDAVAKGAKIECGGKRSGTKGYFYEPTVLTGVKKNMRVMKEEVFGPVIPIIRVRNEEEAIKLANDSDFGLGGSVWTKDIQKGERFARMIEAGVAGVNRGSASDKRMPFGGMKKSGIGREFSRYGLLEFTNIKSIIINEMK